MCIRDRPWTLNTQPENKTAVNTEEAQLIRKVISSNKLCLGKNLAIGQKLGFECIMHVEFMECSVTIS